ncbi:unnamed protein product [Lathyrus sativus]|nr:unnamed protein product [Lathyrus sativus]
MAQLERPQRHVDSAKSPGSIQTMEQLVRAGEAAKPKLSPSKSSSSSACSSPSSPFFQRMMHLDSEEDHGQNHSQKKSVITKVKEKAKKLRHSLSKKRHEDWNINSPPSSAGHEGDGAEEDAEHHGATLYESEMAHEGHKEYTRQHSRLTPVTPQKHILSNAEKLGLEHAREKTLIRSLSKKITQPATTATTAPTLSGPSKIITKTSPEKNQTPAHAEGSETAQYITSKIHGLSVSKPGENHNSSPTDATANKQVSLSLLTSRTPPAKMPSQIAPSTPRASSNPVETSPPSPPASAPPSPSNNTPPSQIWDKGVSVKEYLMNKFEPGEDEKALSRVISEAMSPRRTPGDVGVIEKVREAVTSLLRTEEATKHADTNTNTNTTARTPSQVSESTSTTHAPSQISVSASTSTTRAPSQIPVSFNYQEDVHEENHGRVLQEN